MPIVKTEVVQSINKRPRGRPRKNDSAAKRKAEQVETTAPLKRVKREPATINKTKKEPKVKKEKVASVAKKTPKIKKEPKVNKKKPKTVHKLPPEANIYWDNAMRGRVLRAMKQKMFVLSRELSPSDDSVENFEVLGSIGNSYTVSIASSMKCTCMDYTIRHTHCKHILMVLLKVYRLGCENRMFQKLTTTKEERMCARGNGRLVDPSVLVPTKIRERILKISCGKEDAETTSEADGTPQRRSLDTSDCPICFEEFEQAKIDTIDYCKVCGNNIHQECFNMWKSSKGRDVTCVYCRSKWVFPRTSTDGPGKKPIAMLDTKHRYEGVANFALELGIDRKRDTSTYKTYRGYSYEDS